MRYIPQLPNFQANHRNLRSMRPHRSILPQCDVLVPITMCNDQIWIISSSFTSNIYPFFVLKVKILSSVWNIQCMAVDFLFCLSAVNTLFLLAYINCIMSFIVTLPHLHLIIITSSITGPMPLPPTVCS
jgi:hypothetical protein